MGNSHGKPIVLTDEVNLAHFRLLRVVGKGAFGKVRIVERKDTGLTFALKYIRKDEVVRSESVRNIIRERRMLEHLNHPFLCNLRYSFQDVEYLYIVVDLMNGGDLRFHISRKTFTEEAVRFWIAELGCALRYIHRQGIVHRDVKPDNVLLDSEGHVHLADFNVASDLVPGKALTSKSGTLAYLAPEVYLGRGYRSEVDWWSLGVLFYECIYNKRPFEANTSDALAQVIVKGEASFPTTSPAVSTPCLHAISSLLEKDKNARIGAASFGSFTDNPFFREIDFAALERKEIEPIFCPSSEKTNFDATYDLEELLLEEAPLEARARKQKPRAELRGDATQQEIRADELHRMIETMFEPFNYTLLSDQRSPVSSTPTSPQQTEQDISRALSKTHSRTSKSTKPSSSPSQTSKSGTRTRSTVHSLNGSPPLTLAIETNTSYGQVLDDAPQQAPKPSRSPSFKPDQAVPKQTQDSAPSRTSISMSRPQRIRGSTRNTSISGVVQDPVTSQGSWTDTQQGRATTSSDKPSGMLGFLNRKKGRDRSPKAKERERGVLGKEGARHVVSHG